MSLSCFFTITIDNNFMSKCFTPGIAVTFHDAEPEPEKRCLYNSYVD